MNDLSQDLMSQATRLTRVGRLTEATELIQRALGGAAGASAVPLHRTPHAGASVIRLSGPVPAAVLPRPPLAGAPPAATTGRDEFRSGTHTQASLTRSYRLYVPPGHEGRPLPLVVMLHGCTQDPDDFAAGTDMNQRAREQGFVVLYPAQARDANPSRCWNWFKHNHQQRGSGEPAVIAGMTQAVIKEHGIDPKRVYIAGLSAGGAMAAIVADAYPEIFHAVGVHSGLPRGAASDVRGALSVMKSGVAGQRPGALAGRVRSASATDERARRHIPTIVFHGDQDQTVHPRNGEGVIAAALAGANAGAGPLRVEQGVSPQGRRYTRSIHHGGEGKVLAEHWLVHGAGHAWSGGHGKGSYTDAKGPDATGEMLRFFFERAPA